jgi:N-acyl-D-amino-acid deacylase
VGHSALRYYVMGEAAYERSADGDEIDEMRRVLRSSMLAGAIGLSTSNSSFAVGDGGRPIPSRQAEVGELFALCDVLGELNAGFFETDGGAGTFDFPNHVRTVAGPIALRTGRPAVLGSTVYESNAPDRWREVLGAIESFQADGARVFAQTCPGPIWVNFTMQRPLMFEDLPTWHEVFSLPSDGDKLAAYQRPDIRDAMQFEGVDDTSACFFSRDWNTVTVTEVGRPTNRDLVGRSVQSIASDRGQRVIDTLLDLVVEERLMTRFLYPAANSGNDRAVAEMMRSPQSIIGSSDAGAHLKTLCGAGDTSLLLSRWVRERGEFTLEEAVRLLTFDQASVLGLSRRGLLRRGYAADIVVFDPLAIDYLPTTQVQDLPGGASRLWRDAKGIAKVVVNGSTVVDNGEITGELGGRIMRGAELC